MCNGAPISTEVDTPINTQSVTGNNSSAFSETQRLNDSVQTHLTLNIAGGTFVCVTLIVSFLIIFLVWKTQKIAMETFHQRLHHLSRFVNFPGHREDNSNHEEIELAEK